ncbi:Fusarisetin A cluster transcription factor fsa6 [Fusarium oxysporum f. sp. albedinis]|nr:hypothetical protein HZ326_20762 [Fusarium oxysporum f. sp. albedinis]KAJ0136500.1 Fusarisetin A cluster transcription factor fsa6 [Fusarium oxysporum f. sp. albedinis]
MSSITSLSAVYWKNAGARRHVHVGKDSIQYAIANGLAYHSDKASLPPLRSRRLHLSRVGKEDTSQVDGH